MSDSYQEYWQLWNHKEAQDKRIAELEAENERLRNRRTEIDDEAFEYAEQVCEQGEVIALLKKQLAEALELLKSAPPPREYETVRAGRIVKDPLPPDSVAYGNWFKRMKALAGGEG
jgi:hypothetical protein